MKLLKEKKGLKTYAVYRTKRQERKRDLWGDVISNGKKKIKVKWLPLFLMYNISHDYERKYTKKLFEELTTKFGVIGNIHENPELLKEIEK